MSSHGSGGLWAHTGVRAWEKRYLPGLTPHLGAPSGFIPGCPKLLRFQGHHEHILGKALSKLKKHMVSRRTPEALSP